MRLQSSRIGRRLTPVVVISVAGLFFACAAPAFAASAQRAGAASSGSARWSAVFARPVVPTGSRPVGRHPGATVLRGAVALRPRDPGALAAYAAAVTMPSSPPYEHLPVPVSAS
jgi:hypothetical protein